MKTSEQLIRRFRRCTQIPRKTYVSMLFHLVLCENLCNLRISSEMVVCHTSNGVYDDFEMVDSQKREMSHNV
jgi:hypothetical protein